VAKWTATLHALPWPASTSDDLARLPVSHRRNNLYFQFHFGLHSAAHLPEKPLCALLATVAGFLVLVLHRRLVQGSNAYWS
jgi:hypothetical protein